jgi:anaerobic selenocysteine-containing dehydrogenase
VVQIDPRLRSAGPHADRWLPIRPGTDLALALAIANVLVEQGFVDRPYLSRFTNAASLVGSDGHVLKVGDVEQVWDLATGSASSLADAADPALEGDFEVDGGAVRPAFEVFKADIRQYTPDWAARICGLDAADIRWLAEEMGTQARIGAETVVNGLTIPYRPVGIMAYHVAQQELGFQYVRGVLLVTMLLGSLGAVGGTGIDFSWKIADNFEKLDQVEIKDPPYDFMLKDSKYFPINTGLPGITAKVMIDPERYGVEDLPEVAILHMVNPLSSFPDRSVFIEAWKKLKFVAVISPWMSETADFFADVVLPAATMEKYEGPLKADDLYSEAITLRQPVMDPLFESRGEIDIYLDLADAIGVLTGDEGYVAHVNEALDLEDEPLPTDVRPEVRDIFDRWARAQGVEDGVAYFEEHGVKNKGDRPPEKMYGYVTDPPFGGVTHRFFGESLLRYRDEMEAKGAEETYWRDYTPLPVWRTPTLEGSPSEYDLYLISYKLVEHKQSRSSFNAMLAELTPRQRVDINPRTARRLGVDDGELVWVESQNAVTGETRRVRVHAAFTEAIRPDTVGMPHHFGLWVHPASQGMGPSPNEIYYTGEGYVTNTADQSYLVKVRVYPAGGEA